MYGRVGCGFLRTRRGCVAVKDGRKFHENIQLYFSACPLPEKGLKVDSSIDVFDVPEFFKLCKHKVLK